MIRLEDYQIVEFAKKLLDKNLIDVTKEFLNDGIEREINLWNDFVQKIVDQRIDDPEEYLNGLWQRTILEHLIDVTEKSAEEIHDLRRGEKTLKNFAFDSGANQDIIDNLSLTDEDRDIQANLKKSIYDADKRFQSVLVNKDKFVPNGYKNIQEDRYPSNKYWWYYGLPEYLVRRVSKLPKLNKYIVAGFYTFKDYTGILECYPEFGYERKRVIQYNELGLPESLQKAFKHWVSIYRENQFGGSIGTGKYNGVDIDEIGMKLAKELKQYLGNEVKLIYENQLREPSIIE